MKLKYEPLRVGYNKDGCIKRALDKLGIPFIKNSSKNYMGLLQNLTSERVLNGLQFEVAIFKVGDAFIGIDTEQLDFTNQRGLIVLQVHDTYLHVVAVINNVYYDIVDNLHKYPIHSIIKLS